MLTTHPAHTSDMENTEANFYTAKQDKLKIDTEHHSQKGGWGMFKRR